jgi:hypothetical protein
MAKKSQPEKTEAAIQVRVSGRLLEQRRRQQPKIPPRSDALRELLEQALDVGRLSQSAA